MTISKRMLQSCTRRRNQSPKGTLPVALRSLGAAAGDAQRTPTARAVSDKVRGISRLDYPQISLTGWRVQYQKNGKIVRRFFSDCKHGGRDSAFAQAVAFAAPRIGNRTSEVLALIRRVRPRLNSRSGIPGVTRVIRGRGMISWIAHWHDSQGRRSQRRFSVSVYGEDESRRLAIGVRLEAIRDDLDRLAKLLAEEEQLTQEERGSQSRN